MRTIELQKDLFLEYKITPVYSLEGEFIYTSVKYKLFFKFLNCNIVLVHSTIQKYPGDTELDILCNVHRILYDSRILTAVNDYSLYPYSTDEYIFSAIKGY